MSSSVFKTMYKKDGTKHSMEPCLKTVTHQMETNMLLH